VLIFECPVLLGFAALVGFAAICAARLRAKRLGLSAG
jgi:hypothetical protein